MIDTLYLELAKLVANNGNTLFRQSLFDSSEIVVNTEGLTELYDLAQTAVLEKAALLSRIVQLEAMEKAHVEKLAELNQTVATNSEAFKVMHCEIHEWRYSEPSIERSVPVVIRALLAGKNDDHESEYRNLDVDYEALFERLSELVKDDDDRVWEIEREYNVDVTMTVTVKCTVTAKSQIDARMFLDNIPIRIQADSRYNTDYDFHVHDVYDVSVDEVNFQD